MPDQDTFGQVTEPVASEPRRDLLTGKPEASVVGNPVTTEAERKLAEATERAMELRRKIEAAILAVQQDTGMPKDLQDKLLANLNNALTLTGDAQQVAAANAITDAYMGIVYSSSSDTSAEISYELAASGDVNRYAYPDLAYYGKAARKFISDQLDVVRKHSITVNALEAEIKSLPPELKNAAEIQIGDNYKKYLELKKDPKIIASYGEDNLKLLEDYKLMRGDKFNEIAAAMERGDDRGTVTRMIAAEMNKQVSLGNKVRDEMMPHLEPETQAYLKKTYYEPVNMSAVIRDLHELTLKQRNDLLQAYEENGRDITKLRKEQQNSIHLMRLGVGVEAAISIEALKGVANDRSVMQLVENPSLDPDGKKLTQAIEDRIRAGGSTDEIARHAFATSLAKSIRENPKEKELFLKHDMSCLGALIEQKSDLDEYAKAYKEAFIKGTFSDYRRAQLKDAVKAEADQWMTIEARRAVQPEVSHAPESLTTQVGGLDLKSLPRLPVEITTNNIKYTNGVIPSGTTVAGAPPKQNHIIVG